MRLEESRFSPGDRVTTAFSYVWAELRADPCHKSPLVDYLYGSDGAGIVLDSHMESYGYSGVTTQATVYIKVLHPKGVVGWAIEHYLAEAR